MIARSWHAVIAVFVFAALVLQLWIALRVSPTPADHAVGTLRGTPWPGRVLRVFSFFTIQSNVLAGVTSLQLARRPGRDGPGWRILRLDALFGIIVTGIVYSTVLARIHEPHGWQETSSNFVVHYVVPIMMVLGWLLFGPRPRIAVRTVWLSLIWPALYFLYAMVLGQISGWYPYPFVDVSSHGYPRVLVNAVLVTAVFAVVAVLFRLGDRKLRPAPTG
ncbi:MAG: Pr6Pr family membrane protein [Jatrophihabitantaceae bacterium]